MTIMERRAEMSDHTKITIDEVPDSASRVGAEDRQEARFPRELLGATQTGLAIHRIKPGRRQGFGHRHENAEEICLVLSGDGRVRLDDEEIVLVADDILRIGPRVARRFEAGPEGMTILVFGPHHEGDGELLPDFWADEDSHA